MFKLCAKRVTRNWAYIFIASQMWIPSLLQVYLHKRKVLRWSPGFSWGFIAHRPNVSPLPRVATYSKDDSLFTFDSSIFTKLDSFQRPDFSIIYLCFQLRSYPIYTYTAHAATAISWFQVVDISALRHQLCKCNGHLSNTLRQLAWRLWRKLYLEVQCSSNRRIGTQFLPATDIIRN